MESRGLAEFREHVSWMVRDIQREIDLWNGGSGSAGNLLCALGLLVYTEALGRVRRWNFDNGRFYAADGSEQPRLNFEAEFDRLGQGTYGQWRRDWEADRMNETSIYEVLRSGLVHEYRPKVLSNIHMGMGEGRGVSQDGDRLSFYILPYFDHFRASAADLLRALTAHPAPSLPTPHLRIANAPVDVGGTLSGSTGMGSGAVASLADPSTFLRRKPTR